MTSLSESWQRGFALRGVVALLAMVATSSAGAEPNSDDGAVRPCTPPAVPVSVVGDVERAWQLFADLFQRDVHGLRGTVPAQGICGVVNAVPARFRPVQDTLPVKPPADAVVLFGDGSEGQPKFTAMNGGPLDWKVEAGSLVVNTTGERANHAVSTEIFRDADIHAEFLTSPVANGNSGLYIHGHYEMQIYDSFGVESLTDQDEGSLYRFAKPLVNASRRTGDWQVYDIRYRAPRRDAAGAIAQPGTITAWLNGKLVQDDLEFGEPRSPYVPYKHGVTDHLLAVKKRLDGTGEGPLFLQDHGSPTRFRNVWIRRLSE